jgi:hypothetical protein
VITTSSVDELPLKLQASPVQLNVKLAVGAWFGGGIGAPPMKLE